MSQFHGSKVIFASESACDFVDSIFSRLEGRFRIRRANSVERLAKLSALNADLAIVATGTSPVDRVSNELAVLCRTIPTMIACREAALPRLASLSNVADIIVWPSCEAEIVHRVERQLDLRRNALRAEDAHPQRHSVDIPPWVVGESSGFIDLIARVRKLAEHDVAVLVSGETGTGKEVIVRLLHYFSKRASKPFLPVNVGAIPEALFESELFGHEAGAYTDAKSRRKGLIEHADGGTLFLDEVDALSSHGQVALLRFLQDGSYRPVGSNRIRTADVRVVGATNANLPALVASHKLREDIYYRLAGTVIMVPPLRERTSDILPLANHFLGELDHARKGERRHSIGPDFAGWLMAQPWPGNVRQLRSAIQDCFIMTEGDVLHAPGGVSRDNEARTWADGFRAAKAQAVAAFERDYLRRLLLRNGGNVSRAAREAKQERSSFGRLLRKHSIERSRFPESD